MIDPCAAVVAISALAAALAKGKTEKEIDDLSVFFSQLANALATIAVFMEKEPQATVDSATGEVEISIE